MLDIKHMCCSYDIEIFKDINISNISTGVNCIIGRSGCGKTSLIKAIIGLNDHSSGEVYFNNKKITDFRKFREEYVSYVFQDDSLIPYYTIKENLMMISQNFKEINKLLIKMHLINKINDYPSMLSGGQKQRINIIRACLKHSYINIFDEPTSSVNEALKDEIMQLIKELFKGKIVIIISHNMQLVNKYADRIIDLENNKDQLISKGGKHLINKADFKPPLLKLNFLSYKKRNILPLFVITIVYLIVLSTLSLFDGIDRYVDFNLKKKIDYNYFYIIDSENNNLTNNVHRYSINNMFNIEEIIDYRSLINEQYMDKIKFNDQVLNEYYEIHVYSGPDNILINKKLYEIVNTYRITFMDNQYKVNVIDDGKVYTSPNIYFDYDFLYNIFGKIESKNYAFRTNDYYNVYNYLKDQYNIMYTFDDDKPKFDNSTILINESLKPLLKSIHSLVILLSYSVVIMAITFIKTLIDYNIRLRTLEINIYNYFGLKNINVIPVYESLILTTFPLLMSILLFNYLSPLFNKLSIYVLDEYFPIIKFNLRLLIYILIIVILINIVIFYGNRFNKRKQKLSLSKGIKKYKL